MDTNSSALVTTYPHLFNTVTELKRCPRCEESLPLSEFGVCRARKDGLNLYCKRCIRQKIALSRQRLREYREVRGKHTQKNQSVEGVNLSNISRRRLARIMRRLSPEDRVCEAVRAGAHTQREIAAITRLSKDEVCDTLVNLLLWSKTVRTQVFRGTRMYFINEDGVVPRKPMVRSEPRSCGVSDVYTSIYNFDVYAA